MHAQEHRLIGSPSGTQRALTTLHFGGGTRRAYLQASLHADEVPAMLVAQHLRRRLSELEAQGRLRGEIVLAPACNPLGLAQSVLRHGTWAASISITGENFNRHYPASEECSPSHDVSLGKLGADAKHRDYARGHIREAMRAALAEWSTTGELDSICASIAARRWPWRRRHRAGPALRHRRPWCTSTPCTTTVADAVEPAGAPACSAEVPACLPPRAATRPFDEACSGKPWWQLAAALRPVPRRAAIPVKLCSFAVTVELRGVWRKCDTTCARRS